MTGSVAGSVAKGTSYSMAFELNLASLTHGLRVRLKAAVRRQLGVVKKGHQNASKLLLKLLIHLD